MSTADSVGLNQKAKHWKGKYWGEDGAVCGALFALLSTLYSAMKSAPGARHKLFLGLGILVLYVIIRMTYDIALLSHGKLDVLASVSRKLKLRRYAIHCAEVALDSKDLTFTSEMLLRAGLMRDHDAIYKANMPGSKAHMYWMQLRSERSSGVYNPPEQEIRVLRALAWFANKYPATEHADARMYATHAHSIAKLLGAEDQAQEIEREFGHLLFD